MTSPKKLYPAVVGLALLPAAASYVWAGGGSGGGYLSQAERRQRVLKKMPNDPTVLINLQSGSLPTTPDLLQLGRKGSRALERCMRDNVNTGVRQTCAMVLAHLGAPKARATLESGLGDWDAGVSGWAVEGLRRIPNKSSTKKLMKLYGRRDETTRNRRLILKTLGQLSDKSALRLLRKEAKRKPKKDKPDFRQVAFRAMLDSRHLMAKATLMSEIRHALKSEDEGLMLAGARAAASVGDATLVSALTPLMQSEHVEVRNKAVYAMGKTGNAAATRALVKQLPQVREARMLNNIAFALERLNHKAFLKAIRQNIRHKQAVIRLNSAYLIGDVKLPEGLPMLKTALKDPSDFVRTSAAAALGNLEQPGAEAPLRKLTTSSNETLAEQAIFSLNQITGGKDKDLLYKGVFLRNRSARRQEAAILLGKYGDRRMRNYLLRCVSWPGPAGTAIWANP